MYKKTTILGPKIILTSNSQFALKKYIKWFNILFQSSEIEYSVVCLPTSKKKITLLKSPHVNKKAKEHFELNKYKIEIRLSSSYELASLKNFLVDRFSSVQVQLIF